MRTYKQYLKIIFILVTVGLLLAVTSSFVLDPFQIYRQSLFNKDHFIQDQDRFQNAGLINTLWKDKECCSAIILGSSHSQNFDGVEIGKILKTGDILNLSMSGGRPTEQMQIFQAVSNIRTPSYVLWELHTPFLEYKLEEPDLSKLSPAKILPLYLYDSTILNDAAYLFSLDTLQFGKKQLSSNMGLYEHKQWFSRNLTSFDKAKTIFSKNLPLFYKSAGTGLPIEAQYESISSVIIPTIKNNPDTRFVFFFPPYSLHFYAHLNNENYWRMLNFRKELVKALYKYDNTRVHAMDTFDLPTNDLNQYKDSAHYHPDIGRAAITLIADGKGRLTPSNIDGHLFKFTEKVNATCLDAGNECQKVIGP